MSLFNHFKKAQPVKYTEERTIPKKDIISVQTFTQAKSFRDFRRVRISTNGLDGVEKNFAYFREKKFDFTNAAVQIMTVKANNDFGKCLRIVVDGRLIGNVYRSDSNAEAFDVALDKKVDKVYVRIEEKIIDGVNYGSSSYLMLHWPNMGPKVSVNIE